MYHSMGLMGLLASRKNGNRKYTRKKRYISLWRHEQEMKMARLKAENALLREMAREQERTINVNNGGTYVEQQNNRSLTPDAADNS